MSEQLSPLDSMFLVLEEADEGAHMHIGAALVFDPRHRAGEPDLEALRDRVMQRLPLLPRFSQQLSSARTRRAHWLTWEPAEPDVEAHVRQARLPDPGGEAELMDWLSDFWSHRLDRRRPLWEVVLLDGLRGDRWALVTKTHHALVDGVGGLDIGNVLLDGVELPAPPLHEPEPEDGHRPGRFWLSPGLIVRGAGRLRHPLSTAVSGAALADMLVREEVRAAPRTSLNQPITGTRIFETARFRLEDLKEIRGAVGGTVNDVVLALCAGALRRLLISRGEEPPKRGLRAQIPVNVRAEDEEHDLGNKLTTLYVELPVAIGDPLVRLQFVRDRTEALKHSTIPIGSKALVDSAIGLPPGVAALLSRALYGDVRMFNLTITNVPGPQEQLTAWGAPMREVLPLVPLFAGHGLGIAVFSYDGNVVFGLNADRGACPDVSVVTAGLRESFEELRPSLHRSRRRLPHDAVGHEAVKPV